MLSRVALILAFAALLGAIPLTSAADEPIQWRNSRSLGLPWDGTLVRGVQLPTEGDHFFTWDPVKKRSPNRPWRRWGTDRLVRMLLQVIDEYAAAHPEASRVGVGDLSRPHGGVFDERFGGRGHASHQNGRDVDVYYPRLDGQELRPARPAQVDRVLAQELVTRFVRAGAVNVFVGPRVGLRGPKRKVEQLIYHDDHMHVRIGPDPQRSVRIGRPAWRSAAASRQQTGIPSSLGSAMTRSSRWACSTTSPTLCPCCGARLRRSFPGGSIILSWPAKRMVLNVARRAWLATKHVPVNFYDDQDVAQLADAVGARVARTVKIGQAPLSVDGMARIEL